jgi:hypothetical protein
MQDFKEIAGKEFYERIATEHNLGHPTEQWAIGRVAVQAQDE